MPRAAPKPCSYPGCAKAVAGGGTRCEAHPAENRFADRKRGTRQQRGYGAEWDKKRERIMRRDHGLCQVCLKGELERITLASAVDHIVAKADAKRLGWTEKQTEADENLQAICKPCHDDKTAAEARRGRGV